MTFQSTGLNREITQLEVLAALQALPQDGRNYTVEFETYTTDDTIASNCNYKFAITESTAHFL